MKYLHEGMKIDNIADIHIHICSANRVKSQRVIKFSGQKVR
jgi:hypothetical protein